MLRGKPFAFKDLEKTRSNVELDARNVQSFTLQREFIRVLGFRFSIRQLNIDGKPYAASSEQHACLAGPWEVCRFLVQPHNELGALTGHESLEHGKTTLEVAGSVGRDFL